MTLSLSSPMVRFRLPFPFLLGLFGVPLMLFPELLMGSSEGPSVVPVTDAEVQKAFAFAVERYNQEIGCRNYFKQLRLLKALAQGDTKDEYHLKVELVKTACKKKRGRRMNYERIQKCQQLPGNPEKRMCYFKVRPRIPSNETLFTTVTCTLVATSWDLVCSG